MKTAIQQMIEFVDNHKDMNEILEKLQELKHIERQQIIDSFDEGVKYGNSMFQIFDYPASRYFAHTYPDYYKKTEEKI
jgi:hypothetical protein